MNTNTEQKTVYILQKDLPDYKAGEIFKWHEGSNCYAAQNSDNLGQVGKWPARYVEDNLDWFRRVEVKDWEVVDCLEFNGKAIHPYHEGICLGKYKGVKPCTIHSVRRLSDGETFTVGDETSFGKIKSFLLNDKVFVAEALRCSLNSAFDYIDKMFVEFHPKTINTKWSPQHLCNVSLVKLPSSPSVEQETIRVLQFAGGTDCKNGSFAYTVITSSQLPQSKHEIIKKTIEFFLNN